jgi:hypothetical protein
MKNLPEINHCSPNPEAWWCSQCKAHTTFQYTTLPDRDSRGNPEVTVLHNCGACNFTMFRAAESISYRNKGAGLGVLMILGGVVCSIVEDNEFQSSSILGICFTASGIFFASFILLSVYLRKWSSWSSTQKSRSEESLQKEALEHPFQPEYVNNRAFTEWAEQFLTPEEVERLHEKYGESEDGEKQEARIVLRVEGDPREPPPPAPGE